MLRGNYDMGPGTLGGIRVGGDRGGAGLSMRPMYTAYHDIGLGTLGGIRVGGDKGGASLSMRPIYTTHHDYTVGRAPPRQMLGKRRGIKADPSPPCSFIPKALPIPIHPLPAELPSASISMEKYLPLELYRTINSAKEPFRPDTLTADMILTLQEKNEGRIAWAGVSPDDVGRWESLHPEVIEHDEIRQEYNILNGRFMIKCAPTPTHESVSQFFTATLHRSLNELGEDTDDMFRMGSGMGM